uniref:RING-type domain-containing protein n=1 Tax=viral metagenome TaxID=1070528 RepID=A0A6C0JUJ1_9ZZZZ
MNELDLQTEIFDLLGEKGSCTICQEDFQDGERVRAISKCQHLFHMNCIDSWLAKKGSCPLCRTHIIDICKIQGIYQNIINLHSTLPVEYYQSYNKVVEYIKNILDQSKPLTDTITELNRTILTYCIIDSLLARFKTASKFNSFKKVIPNILVNIEIDGIKPLVFKCNSLDELKTRKEEMIYKIKKVTFWVGSINQAPQIKEIRNKLKNKFEDVLAAAGI